MFQEDEDRDVVRIVDRYPGFVIDGRKVSLRAASRCAPYGIPRGCRFGTVGRYRKTPSWLHSGQPLALTCRVHDQGKAVPGRWRHADGHRGRSLRYSNATGRRRALANPGADRSKPLFPQQETSTTVRQDPDAATTHSRIQLSDADGRRDHQASQPVHRHGSVDRARSRQPAAGGRSTRARSARSRSARRPLRVLRPALSGDAAGEGAA